MKEYGKTVLMVTHDPVVAEQADTTLHLEKGRACRSGDNGKSGWREVWHEIPRLIFANLFRKKVRLVLTIGSFAVALFLFAFLAVVRSAFSRGADIGWCGPLLSRSTGLG